MADPEEARAFYARMMAAAAKSSDARLERAFDLVPREAFLGPGPWRVCVEGRYMDTPSADPCYVYQDVLVALDEAKAINNGEPFLHARWIGAVAPRPGETVVHIGAGTGYYTAILAVLVLPDGRVQGFEIEAALAAAAIRNLEPFENASIVHGDAVEMDLPAADIIYVNAGVLAPPVHWLAALRIGGRLIFPWRPSSEVGLAILVKRSPRGLSARALMPAWFIPCVGASSSAGGGSAPTDSAAWRTRSLHLRSKRAPDASAIAVYDDVWFSSEPVAE